MGITTSTTPTSIVNCHNGATVANGIGSTGGIAGDFIGSITNSSNMGNIKGGCGCGGIVGCMSAFSTVILDCSNSGDVYSSGGDGVGGLSGYCHADIVNCSNTGTVLGYNYYVGGLIGQGQDIVNSYNTGAVTGGGAFIGGVAGLAVTVTNCYNAGTVTGSGASAGGVVGQVSGAVNNSYYLAGCAIDEIGQTQNGIGGDFVLMTSTKPDDFDVNYTHYFITDLWLGYIPLSSPQAWADNTYYTIGTSIDVWTGSTCSTTSFSGGGTSCAVGGADGASITDSAGTSGVGIAANATLMTALNAWVNSADYEPWMDTATYPVFGSAPAPTLPLIYYPAPAVTSVININGNAPDRTDGAVANAQTVIDYQNTAVSETAIVMVSEADGKLLTDKASRNDSDEIVITADGAQGTSSVRVQMYIDTLEQLIAGTRATLTLRTPADTICIGRDALQSLVDGSTSGMTITLVLARTDTSALPGNAGAAYEGNAGVYDYYALLNNTTRIDVQAHSSIEIERPALPSGKIYKVYYVDSGGVSHDMNAAYDGVSGTVSFETGHMSFYVIMPDTAQGIPYYLDGDGNKVWIGFSTDDGAYFEAQRVAVSFGNNTKTFADVPGDWSAEGIGFVTERELFTGTGLSSFSPRAEMTRAMFATVLGRLYERSYGAVHPAAPGSFSDCDYSSGSWYARYVAWAAANGIIDGYGGGRFGPDDAITREQMAAMLYRFASFIKVLPSEADAELTYSDSADISAWAADGARYCLSAGIIRGRDNNAFCPQETASRAEVSTLVMRFIGSYFS